MTSKKNEVNHWMKENDFVFSKMSDSEKNTMRKTLGICGASTKNKTPCCVSPMQNGRCYRHGGATPNGINSPAFKTGRFSKYLPKNMIGRYEEFLSDDNLVSLRDEIAVAKARSTDLLQQLNERGDSRDWEELSSHWSQFRAATKKRDSVAANEAAKQIETMLKTGSDNFVLWNKIGNSFELTRRLEATEAKMLNDMRMTITVENGLAFAMAIVDVVRRHLQGYMETGRPVDKALFVLISSDIQALTNRGRNLIDA